MSKRIEVIFNDLEDEEFNSLLETIKTLVACHSNTCEYMLRYGDEWCMKND